MEEEEKNSKIRFQWDTGNLAHIAEHEVTRDEAERWVRNRPIVFAMQHRSGEERLRQLGETELGRVLIVVTTPSRSDDSGCDGIRRTASTPALACSMEE